MERVKLLERIFTWISFIGLAMVGFVLIFLIIENIMVGDMVSYNLLIPIFIIGFFGFVLPGFTISFIIRVKYPSTNPETDSV